MKNAMWEGIICVVIAILLLIPANALILKEKGAILDKNTKDRELLTPLNVIETGKDIEFETMLIRSAKVGVSSGNADPLIEHDPIYINGNDNFIEENGVASGSGTEEDPYIIENWNINASTNPGIYIKNTDVYFIIRSCYIHDGKNNDGIFFCNVSHGTIYNVTCKNNFYGIYLFFPSNNNILSCTCYNNSHGGIALDGIYGVSNNSISNCNCYNNSQYGIWIWDSPNNSISNCDCYNNDYGIFVFGHFSNNNCISNCNCYNNWCGIGLALWYNNTIQLSNIHDNKIGIILRSSTRNDIHYNNIYNNCLFGIFAWESESNVRYNWWGSITGPSGRGVGFGDRLFWIWGRVSYFPWLLKPVNGDAFDVIRCCNNKRSG